MLLRKTIWLAASTTPLTQNVSFPQLMIPNTNLYSIWMFARLLGFENLQVVGLQTPSGTLSGRSIRDTYVSGGPT
jgi:hypothetical protein